MTTKIATEMPANSGNILVYNTLLVTFIFVFIWALYLSDKNE